MSDYIDANYIDTGDADATSFFPVNHQAAKTAHINAETYHRLYAQSLEHPELFWAEQAKRLSWHHFPTEIRHGNFTGDVKIEWFRDGILNLSENCLDRHLAEHPDRIAILWEPDSPSEAPRRISYAELHDMVCHLANGLKSLGVKKGDRVTIYMPMVPEAACAMLACARIGAIHSVVFGGFSAEALKDRILDCNSKIVLTADEGLRGGRRIPLKTSVDAALAHCPDVEKVVVLRRTGGKIDWHEDRDIWWDSLCAGQSADCPAESMQAEDPLFILYTSGSTGKPKGVLHSTGGYLLYASLTHELVFDYRPGEIFWCTADIGWVTGHSYSVYGPLCNGATTLIFEGVPNYPDAGRFWDIIDRHKVNIFYTAPTAIRALMREDDSFVTRSRRTSLRVLGSVGEPINPEAWLWYYRLVGKESCPIVDTWWQTETGGILISPLIGAIGLKPGSATLPFFGVKPVLVDSDGHLLEGATEGNLCLAHSWPGQARSLYGDHARFIQTYFSTYPGLYFTGDGCRRDIDGYYWITGRVDDVLNVSGHRLGTAEIESALVAHPAVAEAAIVGIPHAIKGQGIYAYITLKAGIEPTEALKKELLLSVRQQIGAIATPDAIQWANALPKTRSGKIMRRILRKIATDETDSLGDTSTLADPSVVDDLIRGHHALAA